MRKRKNNLKIVIFSLAVFRYFHGEGSLVKILRIIVKMKKLMYFLKTQMLPLLFSYFAEKRIVLSTSDGTRTIRISTFYQLLTLGLMVLTITFSFYEVVNFYAKKSKLNQVFTERNNLLIINTQLNNHVQGLSEEVKEINKYLENIGNKPLFSLKRNRNNLANKVAAVNDDNLSGYVNCVGLTEETIEESISLMEEAVDLLNIRSNHLVNMVKNLNIPTTLIKESLKNPFSSHIVEISNKVMDYKEDPNYTLESSLDLFKYNEDQCKKFRQKIGDIIEAEYTAAYLPVFSPVYNYRITSNYGTRIDPINHHISTHKGIDLRGEDKAAVYATGNGIIRFAGWANGYGYMVDVDHGNNIITRYAHMNSINVTKGQHVTSKVMLGRQGSTGKSTAAHVHYEVRYKGRSINPYQFIVALRN